MKLVIATPLYPPEIGGPATYSKLLVEGLPSKGIKVYLVKFGGVRHLPKIIRHYAYYRQVLRVARDAGAVLALDPVSTGLPAMKAAQKAGKPFVVKIVGDYAWEQGHQRFGVTQNLDEFVQTKQKNLFVRKLQKIQKRVAQNAEKIIVPSEYLKGVVMAWGIPGENIQVFNNAIEIPTQLFTPNKKEGEFLVVSAGRRVPWKGFDAIERTAVRHPNWRVFIASGIPREEALGWIKAADVFVLNSTYEGFPHVLIEAMSLGTPVVVTRVGGNAELVTHGETGLTVPAEDDSALEAALVNVANDPAAARERAIAAQKRVGDFSVQHMLDVTAGLLKSL